jgi:hypothetical protein
MKSTAAKNHLACHLLIPTQVSMNPGLWGWMTAVLLLLQLFSSRLHLIYKEKLPKPPFLDAPPGVQPFLILTAFLTSLRRRYRRGLRPFYDTLNFQSDSFTPKFSNL